MAGTPRKKAQPKGQPGDRMGPRPPAPVDTGATGDASEVVDEVTFTEPPGKIMYDWEKIATLVRQHPMTWALVFTQDRTSVVNAIRMGGVAPVHPDLGFQTRTAHNKRGPVRTCDLYLRWNPDKVKPTAAMLHEVRKGQVD